VHRKSAVKHRNFSALGAVMQEADYIKIRIVAYKKNMLWRGLTIWYNDPQDIYLSLF
jgi:hypothetical protein